MEGKQYLSFTANDDRAFLLEHGRIFYDAEKAALWFNWTGAGFSVRFRGTALKAVLLGYPEEMTAPFEHEYTLLKPVVGVHADGGELRRFSLAEGTQELFLFQGADGEHELTLRKLSENVMGKCALVSLTTDGEFLPAPEPRKPRIEFVGDSITCGYGNEATEPGLRTEEENAEATYGFLTAEALGAEYASISVSGCSVVDPTAYPGMENRGMLSMYDYTDAPLERLNGGTPGTLWDFAGHASDVVVINLGTNDMMDLSWEGFSKEADLAFRRNYRSLVEKVRGHNPKALIVCSLGPMGFYLYDEILEVVGGYAAETGDEKIVCFKYGGMNFMMGDMGGDSHPSAKAHARMARELTEFLKTIL